MVDVKKAVRRSIVLIAHLDRLLMENEVLDGIKRSLAQREGHRLKIIDFLKKNGYYDELTNGEVNVLETNVGELNNFNILYWKYESVRPILFALGLVDSLHPYDTIDRNDYRSLLMIGPQHDFKKIIEKVTLLDPAEMEIQKEISMLWHWRAIEANGSSTAVDDWKSAITKSFGNDYEKISSRLSFVKGDFALKKKPVRSLPKEKVQELLLIAENRQRSFEWLVDQSVSWDEVLTDT